MDADGATRRKDSLRILDLLFLAAFALAVGQVGVILTVHEALTRGITGAVVLAVLAGCWWLLRRSATHTRRARVLTMALMLLTASLPFVLDSATSWPMMLVGFIYFVPIWGVLAGTVVLLLGCAGQFALFTILGTSWAQSIMETLATLMIFGCGLGAAWLVADHDLQRRKIAALLASREQAFERESELMLVRERTRAARDLHDGLGHRLTLISMALQFARDAREQRPADAWEQVDHAQLQARDALDHLRRWVRALAPPEEPAGAPLAQIASAFADTGMEIEVRADGEEMQISPELRLYERRFVQEGLTNALRYASGARVVVSRRIVADRLVIGVRDHRAGAPRSAPEGNRVNEGFGLAGLRQRATSLGGSFAAKRSDDGFMINAELPVIAADHAAGSEPIEIGR